MKTKDGLVSSVPAVSMYFEYDSQGRRFKKTVISNSVSTTTYFLYDGWNLIAELDSNLNPIRTYTWGSDISGSMQGAGGVGGLLAIQDSSSSDVLYASYDGNGNLTALIDSSDGSIQAQYEYDPFGNILRMTGDYAEQNPFRFSTKYQDESGWVYYGYRYLVPGLGRWASRDPIGEEGGLGLYAANWNDQVGNIDYLGAFTIEDAWKSLCSRCAKITSGRKRSRCYETCRQKLSDEDIFQEWYTLELFNYGFWHCLPKCPAKLCIDGDGPYNPDPSMWKEPTSPGHMEALLHPGTHWSMRSYEFGDRHSNQCTYDKEGVLLRDYPAAGTVDFRSPGFGFGHYKHDVAPVILAANLDGNRKTLVRGTISKVDNFLILYYQVRPLYAEGESQ